jgi:hypothetical protein
MIDQPNLPKRWRNWGASINHSRPDLYCRRKKAPPHTHPVKSRRGSAQARPRRLPRQTKGVAPAVPRGPRGSVGGVGFGREHHYSMEQPLHQCRFGAARQRKLSRPAGRCGAAFATGLRAHQSTGTVCVLGSGFSSAGPATSPSESDRCSGRCRLKGIGSEPAQIALP